MAKNIHDGVADVTWLKPAGDLVITGVNTMAGNISGGLSGIGIDNSGIHSAISSLMAGVASQIASASAQASSIIANAQASASAQASTTSSRSSSTATASGFDAALSSAAGEAGWHNAAAYAVANGLTKDQVSSYIESKGGSASETAAWLISKGYFNGFANGGIATTPSIFGEAGAEAAVPLPDGRSIPVTFNNTKSGGNSDVLLKALLDKIAEMDRHQQQQNEQTLRLQAEMARYMKKLKDLAEQDNDIGTPPVRVA